MSRCSKDQSQTPCVGSLPPASAASGANIAKPVAASGAFASRPTRNCPVPSDAQFDRSARAKKAASGAVNSAQSSNQCTVVDTHDRMTERALGRVSQGQNGWEFIPLGDFGSLMMRSPTHWPQTWRNWLADNPWSLQSAAIPQGVTKVSQFPASDPKYKVGNIVAPCKNQYNLIRRSGEGVQMGEVTERIANHPYVKKHWWGNQKLTNTIAHSHENAWNVRIQTVEDVKAVVGLTRHGHGRDTQGRQITHYWIGQFSEILDATKRSRLVDLLLNVVGYNSWFCKYGREWTPKEAIDAQSEEPPVAPPQKSTENDGLPVAPRPKSADSEYKALPLSAVSNPVPQTQVDCPLDTEVEPTVKERVSKLNGNVVDPLYQSGMDPWSHRGFTSAIDHYRETEAAEDMPPVAQIKKHASFAEPPVARHPVIEQAPPADVSGEGSTQCLCCPQLLSDTG
jgi:hypothetical protein